MLQHLMVVRGSLHGMGTVDTSTPKDDIPLIAKSSDQ